MLRPGLPSKWLLAALLLVLSLPGRSQPGYWDCDYDSLAAALPQQRTDVARISTLVHLLDLDVGNDKQVEQLVTQLLALNQRARRLDERPYRLLLTLTQLSQRPTKDFAQGLEVAKAMIALFDQAHKPTVRLLDRVYFFYVGLKQPEQNYAYFKSKLDYYQAHGPRENMASCHYMLARLYRAKGNYNRAISSYLQAAALFREYSRIHRSVALAEAGSTYAQWGNAEKGLAYLKQAAEITSSHDIALMSFVNYVKISQLYAQQHRLPEALRAIDRALRASQGRIFRDSALNRTQQRFMRVFAGVHKAELLLQLGRVAQAGELLRQAQLFNAEHPISHTTGYGDFELDAGLAHYYLALKAYPQAETALTTAYRKATADGIDVLRLKYLKELAHLYGTRQQPAPAQRYARLYIDLNDTIIARQRRQDIAQFEIDQQEQLQKNRLAASRQQNRRKDQQLRRRTRVMAAVLAGLGLVLAGGGVLYWQLRRNRQLLAPLQRTQAQLVQAEKMASLSELTAGVAHEIQNPLNFVNNFAEVNGELVQEMQETLANEPLSANGRKLVDELLMDLSRIQQKIAQNGQRAGAIVKSMLEHARSSGGTRQPTDLNALVEEYLRLSYHAMRAKDETLTVALRTDFDSRLGLVEVVPQDISRVLVNLFSNAFYYLAQKKQQGDTYDPQLAVTTKRLVKTVEISIRDNGPGIPPDILNKVFQPFFTTKPPGEGTGLGLSLSYDIITKGHGGTLTVRSEAGEYSEFTLALPIAAD